MLDAHTEVENVIIVGGSREYTEATTLDEINLEFGRLIATTKNAANTVYVCSVIPTIDSKNSAENSAKLTTSQRSVEMKLPWLASPAARKAII